MYNADEAQAIQKLCLLAFLGSPCLANSTPMLIAWSDNKIIVAIIIKSNNPNNTLFLRGLLFNTFQKLLRHYIQ